jgi:hypothetical protein
MVWYIDQFYYYYYKPLEVRVSKKISKGRSVQLMPLSLVLLPPLFLLKN